MGINSITNTTGNPVPKMPAKNVGTKGYAPFLNNGQGSGNPMGQTHTPDLSNNIAAFLDLSPKANAQNGLMNLIGGFEDDVSSFFNMSNLFTPAEDGFPMPGDPGAPAGQDFNFAAIGAKAQFTLSSSAMLEVQLENGETGMRQFDVSVSMGYEYMGVSAGYGPDFQPFSNAGAMQFGGPEQAEQMMADPLAYMREMYSPENTAGRILNFSLGNFERSSFYRADGDTEGARTEFADYIGKAIQKGFDQALEILGPLPEQTNNEIDQTHTLVFDGLEDFKVNGLPKDEAQQQIYDGVMQYSAQVENMNVTTDMYAGEVQPKTEGIDYSA